MTQTSLLPRISIRILLPLMLIALLSMPIGADAKPSHKAAIERLESIAASADSISESDILDTSVQVDPPSHIMDRGISVAVIAVVASFVAPIIFVMAILWLVLHYRAARWRAKYALIDASIRMGSPLPDSFYLSEMPQPTRLLRSGIVWIGWGVAIFLFFLTQHAASIKWVGLVPLFIGLSRLAVYMAGRRDSKNNETASQLPPIPADNDKPY
ncbi:MAG: DUF6249 domain-containing protein [Muribaculaceae bacterium]|nr:DUF6249 domain-containing protein [Muribaculaceae bacterium]